ncbi:MAG: alpha-glucosidase domain-containing protein, partial [Chloroflexota bacterium]|nr:alpha-glucosidase domain-containing protein [Chloroflexota bacterium]
MNPIKQLFLSFQFIGLPATLRIISATLLRDWYEWRFREPAAPETAPHTPGELLNVEAAPSGARCTFTNAELEIRFLTPHLVRLSWEPGQLPLPYAIAKTEWPEVSVSVHESDAGGYTLASQNLSLTVGVDGGITYHAGDGRQLRAETPPQREGLAWTQHARLGAEERIHGLGERASTLNLRDAAPQGESITYQMRNTDPGGHYSTGDDPLYMNIPLYISRTNRDCYLIFYENTHQGEFSFGAEES